MGTPGLGAVCAHRHLGVTASSPLRGQNWKYMCKHQPPVYGCLSVISACIHLYFY